MRVVKVSVIVPVFNAAQYIEQCIHSILDQSLQEIEVIVVNDGSTDDSKKIVKALGVKDDRIFFLDGVNEGVSAARNKGLKVARGEYVGFVDADDWIEPPMLERLFSGAILTDSEMAICNVNVYTPPKNYTPRLMLQDGIEEIGTKQQEAMTGFMDFKYDYANWNKLYKREIIQKQGITFNDEMTLGEDLLFNLVFLHYTTKIFTVASCLYNYRVHESSVMADVNNDRVDQYNLLFTGYQSFSAKKGNAEVFNIFNNKMANGCYNNLIPILIKKVNSLATSRTGFINLLVKELKKFKKDIYIFSKPDLQGFQGVKKRLLTKGNFTLFAKIAALKHYTKSKEV